MDEDEDYKMKMIYKTVKSKYTSPVIKKHYYKKEISFINSFTKERIHGASHFPVSSRKRSGQAITYLLNEDSYRRRIKMENILDGGSSKIVFGGAFVPSSLHIKVQSN